MSLILLGLAVGWPLMLTSIATEDVDCFDAFSRIYNYIFARPWYALWLMILVLLYGTVLIMFVATLLVLSSHLASWAVSSGMSAEGLSLVIDGHDGKETTATTAVILWQNLAGLVLHGFIVSYFLVGRDDRLLPAEKE